jgi:hypothetical protein
MLPPATSGKGGDRTRAHGCEIAHCRVERFPRDVAELEPAAFEV